MTRNIIVEIDSVDVSQYVISYEGITTYGDSIATADIQLAVSVQDVLTLDNSMLVEVWLDESVTPTTKVFNGFLDNFRPEAGKIRCACKDKLAQLINQEVTHSYNSSVPGDASYPDGKISAIFNDIVTTYGGLSTNSGATVQDSGTFYVLTQFGCNHADPFERCKKLADALGWVFYYKPDTNYVYFEPKNYVTNPLILTVGDNVIQVPQWEYDRSEMINDLTIEGAQQLVQNPPQYFSGNASNTVFTLTNTPDNIALYYSAAKNYATTALLASEGKIGNVTNSLATHDFEVDPKNKTVTTTSFVPAAGTNNVLILYSTYQNYPVHRDDPISKLAYTTYKKTLTLTDVTSVADAMNRVQNILAKYAYPFKKTVLSVNAADSNAIQAGQKINVIDTVNSPNVNEELLITTVTELWPQNITKVEVGEKMYTLDEYTSNVVERVKRLEETLVGSTNVINEAPLVNVSFGLVPYQTTITMEMITDSFILDHTVNSLLYNANQTAIVEDFETTTGWTAVGLTQTLTNDSTAGHFWVGTQGLKSAWSGTSGTGSITKTITAIDASAITGAATGTPAQGTAGLWIYFTDASKISEVRLRLGSSSSNYAEYVGQTYAQRNSLSVGFAPTNGLNYLLFDLNVPASVTGTPNWAAMAYEFIQFTVSGATNMTFDYLTMSKNDNLGLNGLGNRNTTLSTAVYTW